MPISSKACSANARWMVVPRRSDTAPTRPIIVTRITTLT